MFRLYKGNGRSTGAALPTSPSALPVLARRRLSDPALYEASPELIDAVNVALHLDRPLLLAGEPGVGKTDFASSLAWDLGLSLFTFDTKSTSTATDVFYTYNALAHFHVVQLEAHERGGAAAQVNDKEPRRQSRHLGLPFISYNALGIAILRANKRGAVADLLPAEFEHPIEPVRSVVLVDEVDKAPRDFPNDILNALDTMAFSIPELANARVAADERFRPVVIFTSNSEKALPDPFLRRCIYFNIPFPSLDALRRIVVRRIDAQVEEGGLLDDALRILADIRDAPGLRKKPGTAEVLDWIQTLARVRSQAANPLRTLSASQILSTCACLIKNDIDVNASQANDSRPVNRVIQDWVRTRPAHDQWA